MAYRDEQIQQTLQFVYISDGNCLKNWKDDDTGALIDILALGTGEEDCLELADRILEGHEVHTIILPKVGSEEQIGRRFGGKGVAEILSGDGVLLYKDWKFTYWSENGFLSIYHDKYADSEMGAIVMRKAAYSKVCGCSPYFYGDEDFCESDCGQWNDCDVLNSGGDREEETCTGTFILGKSPCGADSKMMEFIFANQRRIRAILLPRMEKDFPQISEILKIQDALRYRYYLGGHGIAGLAAEIALSGSYARYQSLEDGCGACISGCFMKEEAD